MNIFGNKTVIGLFDRDKDVEKAVTNLQAKGFGKENDDEIRIIDKHRLDQETPVKTSAQPTVTNLQDGGTSQGGPAVAFNPVGTVAKESTSVEQSLRHMLMNKGLEEEEAEFYAMHVARNSSMVIVETDEDRTAEAAQIMKEAQAKTSTA